MRQAMTAPPIDRRLPPTPGTVRPFDFPTVSSHALPNGLALRVARLPRLPVVATALVIPAAEAALDSARAGHAVLTGESLEGGTRGRSGTELAEALEGIGASLQVSVGWDATTVSLACLAERWEDTLALLAEVVLQPAFAEEEVVRVREQQLARLRQRAMDPASLANDHAAELIHAPGLSYGRPVAGTLESVEGFDSAAAAGLFAGHYHPQGGGLVVTGDIDPEHTAQIAERMFSAWEGAPPGGRDFDVEPRFSGATVHVVDRPDAVQSEIRVGHPGMAIKDPSYHALVVMNTVLGGAFTSRLNLNLRERHGFTYGVRSGYAFRRSAGPFSVSTAVGTDVTASAVKEILGELETMVDGGPTDGEVEAARDYVAGVFPLRLETTGQVAGRVSDLIVYDLPDDHYRRYRECIRAVGRAEAADAARRGVRPDEVTIVVVGAADAVAGPLEELGIAPVTVHPGPA